MSADAPGIGAQEPSALARPSTATSDEAPRFAAAPGRRTSLTSRAIALGVVLMVLVISFASSLRIYLNQRSELQQTRQQIAASEQRISNLQAEVDKWNDPDFVKAEARQRLGWVVPGETGYKVVGPDGKPIGGAVEINIYGNAPSEAKPAWWASLWGSARAADDPASTSPVNHAPVSIGPGGPR